MDKGIVFKNVSVSYGDEQILKGINLAIPSGSFFGITGVNGSGKTTLTYLVNGLIPHESDARLEGRVTVDGVSTYDKPVAYFANKVGMVFQNPDFMLFNLTVEEEIAFGLKNSSPKQVEKRIEESLAAVGLTGFRSRDPQTLSLGQKQKVCLACVLARDPSYIILDEPTAMLDHKSSLKLFSILKELNSKGKTIVVVEHDTDFILKYMNLMAVIDQGKILLEGKPDEVFSNEKELRKIGIRIPGGKI